MCVAVVVVVVVVVMCGVSCLELLVIDECWCCVVIGVGSSYAMYAPWLLL